MTDRELLELAAKAAGYDIVDVGTSDRPVYRFRGDMGNSQRCYFNPLTDDGDALRLAVSAFILTAHYDRFFVLFSQELHTHIGHLAATRRAIVRAAAEIGRNMK